MGEKLNIWVIAGDVNDGGRGVLLGNTYNMLLCYASPHTRRSRGFPHDYTTAPNASPKSICRTKRNKNTIYNNNIISTCCHPIYSGRQICGRTSRGHTGGRSHRISPPSFCGACLNFYCDKDSAVPFPRRP